MKQILLHVSIKASFSWAWLFPLTGSRLAFCFRQLIGNVIYLGWLCHFVFRRKNAKNIIKPELPLAGNRQTHHSRPVSSAHSPSLCSLICTFSTPTTFSPRQVQLAASCSSHAILHSHLSIGPVQRNVMRVKISNETFCRIFKFRSLSASNCTIWAFFFSRHFCAASRFRRRRFSIFASSLFDLFILFLSCFFRYVPKNVDYCYCLGETGAWKKGSDEWASGFVKHESTHYCSKVRAPLGQNFNHKKPSE